jgi:hypothetical protein
MQALGGKATTSKYDSVGGFSDHQHQALNSLFTKRIRYHLLASEKRRLNSQPETYKFHL